MAKFVLAGIDDCPKFANIELLGDKISVSLPEVQITKILKKRKEWPEFCKWIKETHGWDVDFSPIVWRELVDRGGKSFLIGDHNRFQELVKSYYNISSNFESKYLKLCAEDNIKFTDYRLKQADKLEQIAQQMVKLVILGDQWPSLLQFLSIIAQEGLDSQEKHYEIQIVCNDKNDESTHELIEDSCNAFASGYLKKINITRNLEIALNGATFVIITDLYPKLTSSKPRIKWLTDRMRMYKTIGEIIKLHVLPNCRIFIPSSCYRTENGVYFNPLNLDVLFITQATKGKINSRNIIGIPRFYENQARASIADRLKILSYQIRNLIIWGYIGCSSFLDFSQATVKNLKSNETHMEDPDWCGQPLSNITWCPGLCEATISNFIELLSNNSKKYHHRYTPQSNNSEAYILYDSLKLLINGPDYTEHQVGISSLVILSQGEYNVPKGLPFSMPITFRPKGSLGLLETVFIDEKKRTCLDYEIRAILKDCMLLNMKEFESYYNQYDLEIVPDNKNFIEFSKELKNTSLNGHPAYLGSEALMH